MDQNILFSVWLVLMGLLLWYLVAKIYFLMQIRKYRQHAVKQSRSVVMWQVTEQIAPLLPGFPYHYKDVMFMGKGVDYIVFDGMHRGQINAIVFLEIKTGTSQLNKNERMIKDAIVAGKVSYDIWRM